MGQLLDSVLHGVYTTSEAPVVQELWTAVSGGDRTGDDAGPLHRGRGKRHVNYRIDGLVGAIEVGRSQKYNFQNMAASVRSKRT